MKDLILCIALFIMGIIIGFYLIKDDKIVKDRIIYKDRTDTVYVKDTVRTVIKKKIPVYIEVKDSSVKNLTAGLDTVLISNKDTIELKVKVETDMELYSDWFLDIIHKDYQLNITDTVYKEIIKEKEIKFYEEPYFNYLAGLLTVILIIIGVK